MSSFQFRFLGPSKNQVLGRNFLLGNRFFGDIPPRKSEISPKTRGGIGRHLILGLIFITMSPWSAFADPNGGTLDSRMENDQYPIHPHEEMTPGALCNNPDSYRYPEHISYCNRSVETQLKREIIVKYDHSFGYRIASSNRADFKIDHLIPLCMGGANHIDNLWPQHKTVYAITDPLEPTFCNKMKEDKLHQKEAVELIIYAKHHLDEVADILKRVEAL